MNKSILLTVLSASLLLGACQPAKTQPPQPEDSVAPFIDTQRVATMLGGTMELSYMEGLAYDPKANTIYYAMSRIYNKMQDGKGDIAMTKNKCGGILAAKLDSQHNIAKITPLLMGQETPDGLCDKNKIAEPDNLAIDGQGRLWIGEDLERHPNNLLWRFNPQTGELKRFAALPEGAEVAGLSISAAGELFVNVQHPKATNSAPFNIGTVGVISGFNANTDDFDAIALPEGDATKTVTLAKGQYQVLSRAGDEGVGLIPNADGTTTTCTNPDGNMLVSQGADRAYLYTNFECVPGGMLRQTLNKVGGAWQVTERQMVDFRSVNGTWRNCNGTVSPWNTVLSSEEDAVEASRDEFRSWKEYELMKTYLGTEVNEYDYGHVLEIVPTATGSEVHKRVALGRVNVELARVMPDQKTVYLSDDGNARGLYKFVMDKAGDLSAGTLYVAKFRQLDDKTSATGQAFDITWLRMGHGVESQIAEAIRNLK